MRLSRPVLYSALASCLAHSVALGFAATWIVAPPQDLSRPIRVTFVQRAVPLPIREEAAVEKTAAPAAPPPAPPSQPQSTPKPVAKPQKRPVPPKSVRPRPLPPPPLAPPTKVIRPTKPQDAPRPTTAPNPAAPSETAVGGLSLPPSHTAVEGAAGKEGASASGKIGDEAKVGQGRGGKLGNSAQPDYGVNPKPPYPMLARRLGAQGVVLLRVQVREDGSVATVELARSSGFAILDDSATRTVRESWQFVPARIDGTPIASWVEVPIRFILEDS